MSAGRWWGASLPNEQEARSREPASCPEALAVLKPASYTQLPVRSHLLSVPPRSLLHQLVPKDKRKIPPRKTQGQPKGKVEIPVVTRECRRNSRKIRENKKRTKTRTLTPAREPRGRRPTHLAPRPGHLTPQDAACSRGRPGDGGRLEGRGLSSWLAWREAALLCMASASSSSALLPWPQTLLVTRTELG